MIAASARRVSLALLAIGILSFGACRGSTPARDRPLPPEQTGNVGSNGLASALLDTLSHHLARLEIQRVEISLSRTPTSPEVAELARHRAALCQKLREGTSGMPSPIGFAAAVVLRTIEQRLAGLAVHRITVEGSRTSDSADLRMIDDAIAAFERRRSELLRLQAAGTFSPCM